MGSGAALHLGGGAAGVWAAWLLELLEATALARFKRGSRSPIRVAGGERNIRNFVAFFRYL